MANNPFGSIPPTSQLQQYNINASGQQTGLRWELYDWPLRHGRTDRITFSKSRWVRGLPRKRWLTPT